MDLLLTWLVHRIQFKTLRVRDRLYQLSASTVKDFWGRMSLWMKGWVKQQPTIPGVTRQKPQIPPFGRIKSTPLWSFQNTSPTILSLINAFLVAGEELTQTYSTWWKHSYPLEGIQLSPNGSTPHRILRTNSSTERLPSVSVESGKLKGSQIVLAWYEIPLAFRDTNSPPLYKGSALTSKPQ